MMHLEPRRSIPVDVLLSALPSLPRPVLTRLTTRLIERLDELDGDPDLEDDEDCCEAGDDHLGWMPGGRGPGDPDDAEDSFDQEFTDEREPEMYDGGSGNLPPDFNRTHVTA